MTTAAELIKRSFDDGAVVTHYPETQAEFDEVSAALAGVADARKEFSGDEYGGMPRGRGWVRFWGVAWRADVVRPPAATCPPSAETLVVVERMPDHLRDSHRAARNWGCYPHNGSYRRAMTTADAAQVVASDLDYYDSIVLDAEPREYPRESL